MKFWLLNSVDVEGSFSSPPPPPEIKSYRIVDANGTMSDAFEIGEFDRNLAEINYAGFDFFSPFDAEGLKENSSSTFTS
ncbi:hypothetical protein V6N11_057241 [Hibiscus sabdariffa]|uniref:Uncharacterized protein n=1 Tax=Hibiscus sabdariffa TaxID=183260 RepID=A0ABR2NKD2_9ROSI